MRVRERRRSAFARGLAYGTLLLAALVTFLSIVLPMILGAVPLTVLSSSMEPSLPLGSLAVVRPTMRAGLELPEGTMPPEQIRRGLP